MAEAGERMTTDDVARGKAIFESGKHANLVTAPPVSGDAELPDDDADHTPPNNGATAQPRTSGVVPEVARLPRISTKWPKRCDPAVLSARNAGTDAVSGADVTAAEQTGVRRGERPLCVGQVVHRRDRERFFPPEAYLEFTGMSERALVYSPEKYAHRTLVIYEVTALREGVEDDMTSYFVRSLLSEGRIDYEVTVRGKDGGFTTKKIVKEGPTNLIFTTTKTRVHAENETRILSLATDDSREQTARVLLELAGESDDDRDLEPWHDLQRWLADAEHRVTIPYARELAKRVPPVAVRLRRDFGSLLALIRAHAVLHQASREKDDEGRIVATVNDYAVVRDLVAGTLAEGVGQTVSDTVRETIAAVKELAPVAGIMARDIADKLRLDKSTVAGDCAWPPTTAISATSRTGAEGPVAGLSVIPCRSRSTCCRPRRNSKPPVPCLTSAVARLRPNLGERTRRAVARLRPNLGERTAAMKKKTTTPPWGAIHRLHRLQTTPRGDLLKMISSGV